ncbi:MAG: DUF1445 domain-containing protein, partial [Planctomycetaceae bacterium]|nr:DUF1445 domain-containing protein [Planctomycetaceae bacterium]
MNSPYPSGRAVREAARSGTLVSQTSGLAPGFTQANLMILPADWAEEFRLFCERNPRPCPILEIVDQGSVEPRKFAPSADLRTDLPRYRIWR